MDSNITLREMHEQGLLDYIEQHSIRDSGKRGKLRGGNAGSLPHGGSPIGNCPRLAHLRKVGIEIDPTTIQSQIMFDGGLGNEDYFFERVRGVWARESDGGTIVHEEDYPSSWHTSRGTEVSGRGDGVFLFNDGRQWRGGELKGVFSLTTATKAITNKPKVDNLIQAAQYLFAYSLESYELVYVNRSWYAIPEDRRRLVPQPGSIGSEHVQYAYYQYRPYLRNPNKWTRARITEEEFNQVSRVEYITAGRHGRVPEYVTEPVNILPFCTSYLMRFNSDGVLEWRRSVDGEEWVTTRITISSIKNYYEVADSLEEPETKLPPRPLKADSRGYPSKYTNCDYCPLNERCSTVSKAGEFTEMARQYADSLTTSETNS